MKTIRVTAKTLDEAITKALIELGTTSDNLDYTIVEKGTAGLFGFIGAKSYVIEAKRKKSEEEMFEELSSVSLMKKEEPVKKEAKQQGKSAAKPAGKQETKPGAKLAGGQDGKPVAKPAGGQEGKPSAKPAGGQEGKPSAKPAGGQEGKPSTKPAGKSEMKHDIKQDANQEIKDVTSEKPAGSAKKYVDGAIYEASAKNFLVQMFEAMKMEVEIQVSFDESEKELSVNMAGADMGILIGKRGQTLDSLQYLVSLVVNKDCEGYVRVKLDTENYRERRKETLEILAKNIAYKVKRTRKSVSLEPMNPYERRIIHATLQSDRYVVTRSEGEDPFRHVVISLKRENRENKERRYGQENRNSHS